MLALLEFILLVGDLLRSWRFCVALAAVGIAIAVVCWAVDDQSIRLVVSMTVAVLGIAGGLMWQVCND